MRVPVALRLSLSPQATCPPGSGTLEFYLQAEGHLLFPGLKTRSNNPISRGHYRGPGLRLGRLPLSGNFVYCGLNEPRLRICFNGLPIRSQGMKAFQRDGRCTHLAFAMESERTCQQVMFRYGFHLVLCLLFQLLCTTAFKSEKEDLFY